MVLSSAALVCAFFPFLVDCLSFMLSRKRYDSPFHLEDMTAPPREAEAEYTLHSPGTSFSTLPEGALPMQRNPHLTDSPFPIYLAFQAKVISLPSTSSQSILLFGSTEELEHGYECSCGCHPKDLRLPLRSGKGGPPRLRSTAPVIPVSKWNGTLIRHPLSKVTS